LRMRELREGLSEGLWGGSNEEGDFTGENSMEC
jgi:hypothetical protein